MKQKKTCCRSMPRCARCPVLAVRRARAAPRSGTLASVFAEIYSGQPRPLPASVTEALAALALARHPPTPRQWESASTSWSFVIDERPGMSRERARS